VDAAHRLDPREETSRFVPKLNLAVVAGQVGIMPATRGVHKLDLRAAAWYS